MRVLIVSDTHRKLGGLMTALDRVKPELLIHLGDVEGQEEEIRAMADCPCEFVAGNNDFYTTLPKEKEIYVGRYKVLLTHGHHYRVSFGNELLKTDALARDIHIAMYGHTHRPDLEYGNGIVVLNPGSISYPRQANHKPSYIVMDTKRRGEADFTIHYLEPEDC